MRIRRRCGNGQTGRPQEAIDHVLEAAAAFSKHAYGEYLGVPVDARHADAVVGVGPDDAAHESAMEEAALARSAVSAFVVRGAIAGIGRIRAAAITIACPRGV